jgi:hypothetical protein
LAKAISYHAKKNPVVSRFSSCLLIISGTSAILMIANLEEITTIIPPLPIESIVFILILLTIAGFLKKRILRYINIFLQINVSISELFSKILKQHGFSEEEIKKITGNLTEPPSMEINIKLALNNFSQMFPSCYRTIFKVAKKSAKIPLWAHQKQADLLLLTFFTYLWLLVLYSVKQPASRFKKTAIPLRSLRHCVPVR